MAKKVVAQAVGGDVREVPEHLTTLGDVKSWLGLAKHTALVNGEARDDSFTLSDFQRIDLSPNSKGN